MDSFNIIVNGGHQDGDLVTDGWTDILHKALVRPKPRDKTNPGALAVKGQLADFYNMKQIRARVDQIAKDPETAESLKPYSNQFCKRPCFRDEYLDTFNRPNVKLVDTKGKGVEAITEEGVIANGEAFELDCFICATGFEFATG
jgi:cation diffusion facilitator CzcD-associated flavoprotein CzcO